MASTDPIAIGSTPTWTVNTTMYPLYGGSGTLVGVRFVPKHDSAYPTYGYWVGSIYRNGVVEDIPWGDLYASSGARATAYNATLDARKI